MGICGQVVAMLGTDALFKVVSLASSSSVARAPSDVDELIAVTTSKLLCGAHVLGHLAVITLSPSHIHITWI